MADLPGLANELRARIDRAKYHGELALTPLDVEWLGVIAQDLVDHEEDHDDCYSSDWVENEVTERLDDAVAGRVRNLEREHEAAIATLEDRIQQLEREAAGRTARTRGRLGDLRACSRRLSLQIETLEQRADAVAFRLNRTQRYTPEWDHLEPRFERLKAQRARLVEWQRDVEARIASRARRRA